MTNFTTNTYTLKREILNFSNMYLSSQNRSTVIIENWSTIA